MIVLVSAFGDLRRIASYWIITVKGIRSKEEALHSREVVEGNQNAPSKAVATGQL